MHDNQRIIEDLIEEISNNFTLREESFDLEIDYTILFDDLNFYFNNPLNLNIASPEDLEKLHILNGFQIKSLQNYVKKNGPLLSIYELQLVYGFSLDLIHKIHPFVMVKEYEKPFEFPIKKPLKFGNHQVFVRGQQILEKQRGFLPISDSLLAEKPNSRYLGSPLKLYTRYKYNNKNKILWGFTAEKDAGEEFFRGSNKRGFDFQSAHLQFNDFGIFKTIVLGDYQLKFGQGLTLWSGISLGKSSYILNIKRNARGIQKYSSTDENRFLRGVGTTISLNDFNISTFFSKKKIDANITEIDSVTNKVTTVSSFQITGLHAIPNEILDEDAIDETIIGGNISYNRENYKIGLTFVHYDFSANLEKTIKPYNLFDFRGSENSNLGLDYQFAIKNISFFGEAGISSNKGMAFLNGALLNVNSQVSFSVLHRSYDPHYQAYYGNGFSENSTNANENGIYIGTVIHPIRHWKLSAYFDSFNFPWLKYNVDAPSAGLDYLVQVDFFPSGKVEMYWRIKQEVKPENAKLETPGLNVIKDVNNFKFRYHIIYHLSNNLQLRNRLEISKYQKGDEAKEKGYLIYQDIIYKPKNIPLSLAFRYGIFDTDSYKSRIYAYENDVLYAYSVPAYFYKGIRTYLSLKYSIKEGIDLWLRFAQTYYANKETISSGLTEINGNKRTEVKVQCRIKF